MSEKQCKACKYPMFALEQMRVYELCPKHVKEQERY